MSFVYHRVPDNMVGNILYPLGELKEFYPEVFSAHQKKYEKLPVVLRDSIPGLGCFWYDVLHLVAMPPSKIAEEMSELGYKTKLRYYQIDSKMISPGNATIFLNTHKDKNSPTKVTDFAPYEQAKIEDFSRISSDASTLPKGEFKDGDQFLLYYGAPFILYRGRIDVTNIPVIEV